MCACALLLRWWDRSIPEKGHLGRGKGVEFDRVLHSIVVVNDFNVIPF